jgi:hypothetical protein
MGFAAAGRLTPVVGALLQEGIDVLVILNALRALGAGGLVRAPSPRNRALADDLAEAHRSLHPQVAGLASLASRLDRLAPRDARTALERVRSMLEKDLLPHEREEQETAYPVLAAMSRDEDPTSVLVGTHHEIRRRVRLFGRLLARLPEAGPGPDDLPDLQRALYGLHAILTLHFGQEEELYALLGE